jgi:hypothetical protein
LKSGLIRSKSILLYSLERFGLTIPLALTHSPERQP